MKISTLFWYGVALSVSAGAAHIFFKPREDKRTALTQPGYQSQIEAALEQSELGDVRAQYQLAELYRSAPQPIRDYSAAMRWHQKAAEQGYAPSQYALGTMYADGLGVQQNYHRAADWFRLAASLARHADAQFSLGQLYFNGRGVPSDYGLAVEWFRKAAAQGHAVAQFFLGRIYQMGWGVEQDLVAAYTWIALSGRDAARVRAHNKHNDPEKSLANLKAQMNSWQLRAAEKNVEAWKP